jgi:hypothetical protein
MYSLIRDVMSIVNEVRSDFSELSQFDEAPGALAALPDALKKLVANKWNKMGGENSEIVTVGTVQGKSFPALNSLLRKAILEVKNYVMVWVEMDGHVIAGVQGDPYGQNTFNLFFPDGSVMTKTDQVTVRGTGKWDRRLNKFVPPKYFNQQRRDMKSTEAQESLYGAIYGMYKNAQAEVGADVDNFLQSHSFTVKGISVDKNRIAVAADRKAAKVGDPEGDLQREALRKLIQRKLGPLIAEIRSVLPSEEDIMSAIDNPQTNRNGGRLAAIDTKLLDEKMQKLSAVIYAAQSALSVGSSYYRGSNPRSKDFNGKPELNYSTKALLDALNKI